MRTTLPELHSKLDMCLASSLQKQMNEMGVKGLQSANRALRKAVSFPQEGLKKQLHSAVTCNAVFVSFIATHPGVL